MCVSERARERRSVVRKVKAKSIDFRDQESRGSEVNHQRRTNKSAAISNIGERAQRETAG